jgi:hypothetical protein
MDFLDEVRVHYSGDSCANCGGSGFWAAKKEPELMGLKLCNSCLEERHISHDDLKMNVRRQFDLDRSPNLRGCFLRMLLSREVSLEPSGWKTGMALGLELKEAGFAQPESRQIFIQAGANTNVVGGLLDNIYRRKGPGSLTCEQIRGLNVICDECPDQFKINPREHISEIS